MHILVSMRILRGVFIELGVLLEKAALHLAFEVARLHTLKLEAIEDNDRAVSFYKRMGFQEEGRLREFVFKDNQWKHVIVMGMVR